MSESGGCLARDRYPRASSSDSENPTLIGQAATQTLEDAHGALVARLQEDADLTLVERLETA